VFHVKELTEHTLEHFHATVCLEEYFLVTFYVALIVSQLERRTLHPVPMSVILLLLLAQPSYMKHNHTDLEEGQPARYDLSVSAFYQIYYCQPREPCKEQFREEFMCRCTNRQVCVSPGKFYDAFCQVETMGVIWVQPKIIEYHGRIIILQPSSPHKNEIKLLTFGESSRKRREKKRKKKKKKR